MQVQKLIDIVDQVDEKDDSTCEVSEHMNMENKIHVDEQTLRKKLVTMGVHFLRNKKHYKRKTCKAARYLWVLFITNKLLKCK